MNDDPSREELDARAGALVVEFGAGWCGICAAARPMIDRARVARPGAEYLRVEDGPGRRLGRSFGVKLWPTLVFLQDGTEVARVVRPDCSEQLDAAFGALVAPTA